MTNTQAILWKLADAELKKLGGLSGITRNRDAAVREAGKTEGTREWALVEASRLASPANDGIMTDEYCQTLINIIKG